MLLNSDTAGRPVERHASAAKAEHDRRAEADVAALLAEKAAELARTNDAVLYRRLC